MKNKMMRIASILMVAVLLTVCAVSGTFAKYVTTANASDTARVAKWGVVLGISGDGLFAPDYKTDETGTGAYTGEYSVSAEEVTAQGAVRADLVAPGTKSDPEKPVTISIKGTPEVATRITVELGKDFTDVVLPKGEYTDYTKLVATTTNGVTTYGYTGTFTLTEDYYPIVYTLKQTANASGTMTAPVELVKGTLAQIKAFLDEFKGEYAPNTVLNAEFTLTWEWAFETDANADPVVPAVAGKRSLDADATDVRDQADTYLGNVAAGALATDNVATITDTTKAVSTTINFDLAIVAVQID